MGVEDLLSALMPFIKAMNRYLAPARSRARPQIDLQMMNDNDWLLLRGGGFDMQHKGFFQPGVQFRIPGFLAATPTEAVARQFMERAFAAGFPPVRWKIIIDKTRGCFHMNYLSRSLISNKDGKPAEDEFVFTQFSTFKIITADWVDKPTPWHPHEITVEAEPDNLNVPSDLPLAPWN